MKKSIDAITAPLLMFIRQKDGRLRLLVESRRADESSVQLNYLPRGLLNEMEVIDARGFCFNAEPEIAGIDWAIYLRAWIFAPFLLLLGFVLFSVMVRIKLNQKSLPVRITLDEMKTKVCDAIQGNPDFYTYAPPEEIMERVTRARSPKELIRRITLD